MNALLASILLYKYVLLIPLAIIEGPMVSIYSGFLIQGGIMRVVPAYLCLMLGDLLGDVGWYLVGYYSGRPFIRRFGKYFSITDESVATATRVFHRHNQFILLFSKITTGFGLALAVLVTAGMVKIPFRRYLLLNFLGQIVWTGMMLSLGYFFGHLYAQIEGVFGKLSFFAAFVVLVFALFGLGKYLGQRFIKQRA